MRTWKEYIEEVKWKINWWIEDVKDWISNRL